MINTLKEKICLNKLISSKKEICTIENDVIVPDSKPDLLNIISTSGIVCIYKKELANEKIKIDGDINTCIMYLTEDIQDKIRSINVNMDFSEIIQLENIVNDMQCNVECNIKSIETKLVNGRKLNIRVILELDIDIYENNEVEIITHLDETDEIQMLKEEMKINSIVGIGENKLNIKDTIILDNLDNVIEIVKNDLKIINKDIKISYNKILTKAEAEIKIMYLTSDSRIKSITSNIPVVSFIDLNNVKDGNICDINYELKNMILRLNPEEEHSIYIEMDFEIKAIVFEEKDIIIIQDIYSPLNELKYDKKDLNTIMNKQNFIDVKQIKERLVLEEFGEDEILDTNINIEIIKEIKRKEKLIYECSLNIEFMFINKSGFIYSKVTSIPFDYSLEDKNITNDINSEIKIEIRNQNFIIQEGNVINCNIDLGIELKIAQTVKLNMINDIEVFREREAEEYNMTIYIVKKDDSMWEIAKKMGSTIQDILKINDMNDEVEMQIGQKLFIPKYIRNEKQAI